MSPAQDPGEQAAASGSGEEFQATEAYSRYVLGVLFVVYIFNFIDRQILAILLDPIKAELGVSDTAMGFLTGFAFAIFYTVAGIPIARMADRGTRRTIIAVGLTVWSVMTAVCGAAQNFVQLAMARVGVGIGEAAGSPPAHSLISDYFPAEKRATAISFYNSGISIGVMLGYLLGGWINELFNWRVAFLVVGLPGVALAIVVRYTIREPPRGHSEVGPVDTETDSLGDVARFLLGMRSFKYFAVGTGLAAFSAYGFGSWVPAFLGRVHGMGSGEMGTWLGIENGLGGALGAILGGLMADRLGRKDPRWYLWTGIIGMLIYLPFVVLFLLLEDTTWALVCYLPAITFASMYLGPVIALTHRLVKVRMRALASAILLFILNMIGMGLGPQAVGIANDLMASSLGAEAVRYSLLYSAGSKIVAVALFLMAARHLASDLEAKNSV